MVLEHLRWPALIAGRVLEHGGVLAYPTDTVWGLGCDPYNERAVQRILDIKQRPREKGLILVVSQLHELGVLYRSIPDEMLERICAPQKRPTTWLIPDPYHFIPEWIRGRFDSVAVRVSTSPAIVAMCRQIRGPLVSTSANPAGLEPARSRLRVRQYFQDSLDLVFPGEVQPGAQPSIIRDAITNQIIRV
ncbi:MAG: Sua5/YciO/YrdC/YwlC family protein [Oleiphilaceae bacterium]|nr:Sua5/YciO/YrdC/YwlC family protein [Oleiphilaceae bacterium]